MLFELQKLKTNKKRVLELSKKEQTIKSYWYIKRTLCI